MPAPSVHETANVYGDAEIGYGTKVAAFVEIGSARIGKNCSIQCRVFIPPGTAVEDDVFLGPSVTICNVFNPRAFINRKPEIAGVTIRKGASIGAGVVILPGVEIGRYAMVGAGSVVTRDVEPYSLVVGNPARHVRYINEEAVWGK